MCWATSRTASLHLARDSTTLWKCIGEMSTVLPNALPSCFGNGGRDCCPKHPSKISHRCSVEINWDLVTMKDTAFALQIMPFSEPLWLGGDGGWGGWGWGVSSHAGSRWLHQDKRDQSEELSTLDKWTNQQAKWINTRAPRFSAIRFSWEIKYWRISNKHTNMYNNQLCFIISYFLWSYL